MPSVEKESSNRFEMYENVLFIPYQKQSKKSWFNIGSEKYKMSLKSCIGAISFKIVLSNMEGRHTSCNKRPARSRLKEKTE